MIGSSSSLNQPVAMTERDKSRYTKGSVIIGEQCRWLYLEPILSGDDGELGLKFRKVNQGFRQVARAIEGDSRLSTLVQSARLRPMLDSISEQLHVCQAALNQYIEDKRSIFPRFYFLSDDDLLELLGQARAGARAGAEGRAVVIQTHLRKLFPGITGVKLGPGDLSITALCSHQEEIFYLDRPVDIDCPVEIWLKNVENEMHASLKNLVLNYVMNTSPKNNDVFSLPVQILCLAQNIRFTEQTERAITSKELHKLKVNIDKEYKYYAEVPTDDDNERLKRQALILQCAYYLNVIQLLIDNNVATTSQWLWQKQLRFYLLNTKEVVAKMGLAELSYSYEYLGINTGQFARTELSDQCFLVLTQAFHLGLVGNPFGPAGTGKTESVKALGGLIGRLVLVFNCDEAMDSECMGRLLSGLARCGAWGCFDELNRLTAPTLAALSQYLSDLLPVLTDHSATAQRAVTINGNEIAVSQRCAIAATMNPAGRGYGGRRALPAALQRVLRPVAMCQPRGDILARHLLAARAIINSQRLADDLHQVFYMASDLLSIQRHYDWGLRALKATIGSCAEALTSASPERQRAVLRAALRHNNMSKLTRDDAQRFEAIMSVVFADVTEEELLQTSLKKALEDVVISLGLVYSEEQIQKCMQLHEQLQQRMGVVLVGPPGSGKTTICQILKM
ncbi:Cytoplasmic dynein 2 heavy chain 1, partial [Eumeta japonica]